MIKIEVLGTGCAKCRRLTKNVEAAVEAMSIEAEVVGIMEITEIMDRGILLTPALMIDGELVVSGRVADVDEITELIQG